MTEPTDDPLFDSTLRSQGKAPSSRRATLPCLTVLGHADRARLGERAALKALLVGQSVEVSRAQLKFGRPGEPPRAPLADPHLSRTPFRIRADGVGLVVEPNGVPLSAEGRALTGPEAFTAEQLERGVVLELGGCVLLLLHGSTNRPLTRLPGLLGQSDEIDELRCEITSVADLSTPVLIRGETGTGKELVAQAIHQLSPRCKAPFVAVNMAAVSESTAVSSLFGHARGAFTGAQQRHEGVFERAAGGTLLLDEIGETPGNVQAMLLRAIETRRVMPLGDAVERDVDVRFVAATDADLERELEEPSFSAALLHRLAGYELHVPELRARREDIPLLLMHFIDLELAATTEPERASELLALLLSSRFLSRIVRHPLPGNVRQLRNLARHLVISNRGKPELAITKAVERALGDEGELEPPTLLVSSSPRPSPSTRPAAISNEQLLQALRDHGWSPNRAAASLGIATGTLHDLMRRSGGIRRAADLSKGELRAAQDACDGDTRAMAEMLCVSERGLRIALRQRGLLEAG
jgi:two-component system, NtrC family, nitrogen regulation response regulator GlnG